MDEFNEKNNTSLPESTQSVDAPTSETTQLDDNIEQKVYYKELTPTRMVLRRFFRSRLSVVGLVMIIALFVFAFLGPPIFQLFGYNWGEVDVDYTPAQKRSGDWMSMDVTRGMITAEITVDNDATQDQLKDYCVSVSNGIQQYFADESVDAITKVTYKIKNRTNNKGGWVYVNINIDEYDISAMQSMVNAAIRGLTSSGKITGINNFSLSTGTTTEEVQDYAYYFIDINTTYNPYAAPSAQHFLGTDSRGMDVFARLMYGGRISLTIGFVVVILETLLGVIMGGISGYFGGWVDNVIMRIVDILNCIPTLPLLLIASVVIDSWGVPGQSRIYYLMAILTIFGWSGTARMVRGQILYLREQEYIVACEVMGIPTWRRIFLHLVPNIMPQLIVSMTLGLGSIILYEATLSYLGLGIPAPYAAWGTMISSSTDPMTMSYYPFLWIPAGLLIVIAVLGFNFVGDGLRDAMDPKARK